MAVTTVFQPGFVLEQTLGHVTHSLNLKRFVTGQADVQPRWFDVPFRPQQRMYRLPPASLNWSLRGSLFARSIASGEAGKLDALFVHTLTVGLLAGNLYRRIPSVISVDATPMNLDGVAAAYNHRKLPAPLERLKQRLTEKALQPARAYVAWCQWAKDSLVKDYSVDAAKVEVIAPGADIDLFGGYERQPHDGPVRILFVGGDFERKGGDVLLDVYRSRLAGKAELHIVTGSDVRPEDGVHVYRGLTANSEGLLNLFRSADIFALPTRADCLAVVLGEAMAASLPIVTTPVGAHSEAVQHGKSGLLVAPGDAEQLGDALELLVDNPETRRQMGQAGRQLGEERFDARKNALRVLDLLKAVA